MLRLAQGRGARRVDEQRGPGRAQGIGGTLGGADQFVGAGQFADRDDQPLARRPLPADASDRTWSSICASTACAALRSASSRKADRLDLEKKCDSARVASCGR